MKKFFLFILLLPAMLVQAAEQITVAEFKARADENTIYRLRGEVTNITNTKYGTFDLKDATGSVNIYGTLVNGQTQQWSTLGIEEGDTIVVEGKYKLYYSKVEIENAEYISHTKASTAWVPVPVTIEDFIAYNDGKRYILTGVVSSITNASNGNFTLTDETAGIIVYGLKQGEDGSYFAFGSSGIEEGDTLTISGIYQYYNNTTHEVTSGRYISHQKPQTEEPPVVYSNLRVCAQNLENYYFNYTQSDRPSYSDAAGFQAKTVKIVNAMLDIDADIYAFCEVEAKPIVLQQLADSMNAHAGVSDRYAAVSDGINYTWYEGIADNQIKSGFIYRKDKVSPYGSNTGGTSGNGYYAHTMRIQAFKQTSTNEALVLSMNHFKAKDSSADQGESMRQTNANNLVNALSRVTTDPDILILGDLNCEYGEAPITTIINAGFEEQLLKYNSEAWSHCYGGGELIDHVLANSSMAEQIVNAYVAHICAYWCNNAVTEDMSWSDHDPYVIEIKLGKPSGATALETVHMESSAKKVLRQGQLIIIRDGVEYTITGQRVY